mmetsp:Transcript_17554/g.31492  ORF Transcript_17554/g.31492 Transcript_17554/m.31492 type:complete len:134 (+) Transcript_17554:30-431(+)
MEDLVHPRPNPRCACRHPSCKDELKEAKLFELDSQMTNLEAVGERRGPTPVGQTCKPRSPAPHWHDWSPAACWSQGLAQKGWGHLSTKWFTTAQNIMNMVSMVTMVSVATRYRSGSHSSFVFVQKLLLQKTAA